MKSSRDWSQRERGSLGVDLDQIGSSGMALRLPAAKIGGGGDRSGRISRSGGLELVLRVPLCSWEPCDHVWSSGPSGEGSETGERRRRRLGGDGAR